MIIDHNNWRENQTPPPPPPTTTGNIVGRSYSDLGMFLGISLLFCYYVYIATAAPPYETNEQVLRTVQGKVNHLMNVGYGVLGA